MIMAIITIRPYDHVNYASNEWNMVNIGQLDHWLLTHQLKRRLEYRLITR